jgi:16S rRNA (adenine1518-N6/adenine1519-N6)-dimethyltransferase
MIPKKQYSQNFLINKTIQEKIISTFEQLVTSEDNSYPVIEIGPGRGDMTSHLITITQALEKPFFCLELDPESVEFINTKLPDNDKINGVILVDALQELENIDSEILNKITNNHAFNLFSSLPYASGSRMLVAMGINYTASPFCVIVQKEVAKKANLKTGKLTVFGIWINLFWDTKLVFDIAPGNFYPAPKVNSALLTGRPKKELPEYLQTVEGRKIALQVLKNLLAMPKKTIHNNLKPYFNDKDELSRFLLSMSMNDTTRLSIENYEMVMEKLTNYRKNGSI